MAGNPLTHLVVAVLVFAVVQSVFVKLYQVPSGSMEQTLRPGDRVLVDRLAYIATEPVVGDVVVFNRPDGWSPPEPDRGALRTAAGWLGDLFGFGPSNEYAMAKRIIAGPGQTVECCDDAGRLLRDGAAVDESYLGSDLPFTAGALDCSSVPQSLRCFRPLTVPSDRYFMLGDNRALSSDSISSCRGEPVRATDDCVRLVPTDQVVGRVFFVLFPFDRWEQPLSWAAP